MGQAKTTIELNGKTYDAASGAVVGDAPAAPTPVATVPTPKPVQSRQVMDGFFRPPAPAPKPAAAPTPVAVAEPEHAPVANEAKEPTRRTDANHKPSRQTEQSQTLMRHAVSKPKLAQAPATAAQIKEKGIPKPASVSHDRQKRAEQTSRSSSISKFSMHKEKVPVSVAPLEVQPHPQEEPTPEHPTSVAENQFKQAMSTATSHQQAAVAKTKLRHKTAQKIGVSSRAVSFGAAGLAAILLIAFIAYQNVPNVSMRVASSKAGFHASLPGYTPSGFGVAGPIQTSPGTVTVNFKSNSDNRNYQVSQSPSNWSSQALLTNYVASNKKSYQVVEDKGKTVYIYDGTNATWVNGGVWYKVTGNANLSSQQLVSIADSL